MIDHATNETQQFTASMLSPNATTLYQNILGYLKFKNSKGEWISDNRTSKGTRLTLPKLAFAQSELSRSGLLVLIPGTGQTRYELPDEIGAESL